MAMGGFALLAAGCADSKAEDPEALACSSYVTKSADERRVAVEAAAADIGIDLSRGAESTAAELDHARALVDDGCREAPIRQIGEAMVEAGLEEQDLTEDRPARDVAEPPVAEFSPSRFYRWSVRSESNATAEIKLEIGDLITPGEPLPASFEGARGACDVNDQRDALIPMRMSVENTTSGFDLAARVTLRLQQAGPPVERGAGLEAATSFSSGPACEALTTGSINDGAGVRFDAIVPSATRSQDWLLVVHGFRSPAYPEGDDDALKQWFGVLTAHDGTSTMRTQCFEAPARRYAFTGGFVALGGAMSPAFPVSDAFDVKRDPSSDRNPTRCAGASQSTVAQSCPRVQMFYAVGSGNKSKAENDRVDEVTEILRDEILQPERATATGQDLFAAEAVDYPAVSVVSPTGIGAALRFPGAYHRSVVAGKDWLRDRLAEFIASCGTTKVILSGYSQGAQVVGDVYQELEAQDKAAPVFGVVLFGDPYFNPFPAGRGSSLGKWRHDEGNPDDLGDPGTHGALGRRPDYEAERVRSYCHGTDPVCQAGSRSSNPARLLQNHLNYAEIGEAGDAGRWLSTELRAAGVTSP